MELTITRKDGTKARYDFKSRTKLSEVDEKREIITFFDNGQCFVGYCDGDVDDDAHRAFNGGLEQRRADGALGGLGGLVLAFGGADAHVGESGVEHD